MKEFKCSTYVKGKKNSISIRQGWAVRYPLLVELENDTEKTGEHGILSQIILDSLNAVNGLSRNWHGWAKENVG